MYLNKVFEALPQALRVYDKYNIGLNTILQTGHIIDMLYDA